MGTPLPPVVEQLVDMALNEDLGNGDITTRLTVPPRSRSAGSVIARQSMVVSGSDVFVLVLSKVDPTIETSIRIGDGERAAADDVLIEVSGPTDSLLMAERVALNFLQRLSGVATLTRSFVDRLPDSVTTAITDTRKTSPGMRYLERRAVVHGGGRNHRADLGGGILIKENHIVAAGSVRRAVAACKALGPHPLRVEVEVRNEQELAEALEAGADAVLLDNMTPDQIRRSSATVGDSAIIEISGGITIDNIDRYGSLGADIISIGGLTHSAPSADISFLLAGA